VVCAGNIPPALARDLSVSTLPSHKGSDNHTNASRSGISATQGQKLAVRHFLIHLVIQSLICLPFCSSLLVYMHVFHFGKLVMTKAESENRAANKISKQRKCNRKNPLSVYKEDRTPLEFDLPNCSTNLEYTLPSFTLLGGTAPVDRYTKG